MKGGSALAGRTDEAHIETLLECKGHKCGFAVSRDALDTDVLRIYVGIGLEIIEAACRAPGPCAQGTPIVRFAGLALVHEADDAAGESGAVVSLDTARVDHGVAPSGGEKLLVGRRILAGSELRLTGESRERIGRLEWLPCGIFLHKIRSLRIVLQHAAQYFIDDCHIGSAGLDGVREVGAAEHHEKRNRSGGVGGSHDHHLDIDIDRRT